MTRRVNIARTNTILYCDNWQGTVAFYTETLDLAVTFRTEWFVEVELCGTAHLSIADASRATIEPNAGAGLTLSWQVADLAATRRSLVRDGVAVSAVSTRWECDYVMLHDPEGNRIELWSPSAT